MRNRGRQQPWSTYAVHLTTLTAWALPTDCLMLYLYGKVIETWTPLAQRLALGLLVCWMVMSKSIKLVGHFWRYPGDVVLLPVSILFGYAHGFIKLYAMLTLHVVS